MANKQEKAVVVNQNATYEHNDTKERVVPFLVDRPRENVRFAPIGSGREDSASIADFLDNYTLIAQQGEPLPEDAKDNAKANADADAAAEKAQATPTRAPKLDTTTASPTRADLEARANARNQ